MAHRKTWLEKHQGMSSGLCSRRGSPYPSHCWQGIHAPYSPVLEIPQETCSGYLFSHVVQFISFPLPQDLSLPCGNLNALFFCPIHHKYEKLILFLSIFATAVDNCYHVLYKMFFFRINNPNSLNLSSDVRFSRPLINFIAFLGMHYAWWITAFVP